jgi:hypothetical protein
VADLALLLTLSHRYRIEYMPKHASPKQVQFTLGL